MTESAAPTPSNVTTLAGTVHMNSLYPQDVPLIRVRASGELDPVTTAIACHVAGPGTVFVELPDGRLTVVLRLHGKTWIARPCDERIRSGVHAA